MKNLLYLSHRIPYPPNKGDKIRSWHLLRQLTEQWNVHLAAFIDDPDDWQHTPVLEKICCDTKFIGLHPAIGKVKALRGFLAGTSLTVPYYRNAELSRWVSQLSKRENIDHAVVFSSSMAQYVEPLESNSTRIIIDFCDMDSDKWRQYSEKFSGLKRWVYSRESSKLREEEAAIASRFDASVLISEDEAKIFCEQTGTPASKVHTVPNGVDTVYFDPNQNFANPYQNARESIVFVGAMDYWPNIDAVTWFVKEVLPFVLERRPDSVFYIVGSSPGREVVELSRDGDVVVTGRVDDVRPFLRHAHCVVAPLRVARGVQNKVLEAMAMARPVLATNAALEGIDFNDQVGITVCNTNTAWIDELISILEDDQAGRRALGARKLVASEYSWQASAGKLAAIVNGADSA